MSVQNQIKRIEDAKAALKVSIEGKGVTVSGDVKLEGLSLLVDQIVPKLQSKTIAPETIQKTVSPDPGYDGLSKVTIGAMPTAIQATPAITISSSGLITAKSAQAAGYVFAGTKTSTNQLSTQATKTVIPSTTRQTAVTSGKYTTGVIYVAGDTNLKAENIKKDISIFGVNGSYKGSGGSGSGGSGYSWYDFE